MTVNNEPDLVAKVDQAGAYLEQMGGVIAQVYQVLTDGERWSRPMPDDLAAHAAEHLVITAMEMAAWDS